MQKAYLKQVVNASHLNAEERTLLLSLLKDFEDLVDGTLGDWSTDPVSDILRSEERRVCR